MILDKSTSEIKSSATLLRELAELYYNTFNSVLKIGCGTCVESAVINIKLKLNKMEQNIKNKSKKCNFVLNVSNIREFNSSNVYTNDTLTDEIAIAYIKVNKGRLSQFSKTPDNLEELLAYKKPRKRIANKKVVVKK